MSVQTTTWQKCKWYICRWSDRSTFGSRRSVHNSKGKKESTTLEIKKVFGSYTPQWMQCLLLGAIKCCLDGFPFDAVDSVSSLTFTFRLQLKWTHRLYVCCCKVQHISIHYQQIDIAPLAVLKPSVQSAVCCRVRIRRCFCPLFYLLYLWICTPLSAILSSCIPINCTDAADGDCGGGI